MKVGYANQQILLCKDDILISDVGRTILPKPRENLQKKLKSHDSGLFLFLEYY